MSYISYLTVFSTRRLAPVLCVVALGCGDGRTGPPADGGGDVDGGRGTDSGARDAGARDAARADDAGGSEDGGARGDAGDADGGGGPSDAGSSGTDGCLPIPCPAPPPGCTWVAGGSCTCGTLSCDDAGAGCECGADKYCDYDVDYACGGPYTCRDIPFACPDVFIPVCGCDGNTYGNSCEAAAAGTDYASEGECATTADDCRATGCAPSETCMICRGSGWIRLPAGTVC